jgi:HAD hydrolase, family IIB
MVAREEEIEADFIAGEYRNKFYITNTNEEIANPQLFGVNAFVPENQFNPQLVTKNPSVILLQTRAEDKYALADQMSSFYQHELTINTWGGPLNILECTPKGVHKAFALKYLLNIMNADRKDLIAFGDEHNDTEMLEFAGTGYAMKNANASLLPFADQQLGLTNDQDGVAHELMRLFL